MTFYRLYVALAAFSLAGCPTPPPIPPVPPVDASDAAPWAIGDAAPSDACATACANMTAACGPQRADCLTEMQHNDLAPHIRRPDNAKGLTCADIAAAPATLAAMRAIGACP